MKKIILLMFALSVASCAVNKRLMPTGGSKADGFLEMQSSYMMFQKPVINWDLAKKEATERCQMWGYRGAKVFSGVTTSYNYFYRGGCNSYNENMCNNNLVRARFQCTN